jgi:hypothetical protein
MGIFVSLNIRFCCTGFRASIVSGQGEEDICSMDWFTSIEKGTLRRIKYIFPNFRDLWLSKTP